MFSIEQKRQIADAVQKVLRDTNHPELPAGEISFHLHVDGAERWSWADIRNNGAVPSPDVNPWNEIAHLSGGGILSRGEIQETAPRPSTATGRAKLIEDAQ